MDEKPLARLQRLIPNLNLGNLKGKGTGAAPHFGQPSSGEPTPPSSPPKGGQEKGGKGGKSSAPTSPSKSGKEKGKGGKSSAPTSPSKSGKEKGKGSPTKGKAPGSTPKKAEGRKMHHTTSVSPDHSAPVKMDQPKKEEAPEPSYDGLIIEELMQLRLKCTDPRTAVKLDAAIQKKSETAVLSPVDGPDLAKNESLEKFFSASDPPERAEKGSLLGSLRRDSGLRSLQAERVERAKARASLNNDPTSVSSAASSVDEPLGDGGNLRSDLDKLRASIGAVRKSLQESDDEGEKKPRQTVGTRFSASDTSAKIAQLVKDTGALLGKEPMIPKKDVILGPDPSSVVGEEPTMDKKDVKKLPPGFTKEDRAQRVYEGVKRRVERWGSLGVTQSDDPNSPSADVPPTPQSEKIAGMMAKISD